MAACFHPRAGHVAGHSRRPGRPGSARGRLCSERGCGRHSFSKDRRLPPDRPPRALPELEARHPHKTAQDFGAGDVRSSARSAKWRWLWHSGHLDMTCLIDNWRVDRSLQARSPGRGSSWAAAWASGAPQASPHCVGSSSSQAGRVSPVSCPKDPLGAGPGQHADLRNMLCLRRTVAGRASQPNRLVVLGPRRAITDSSRDPRATAIGVQCARGTRVHAQHHHSVIEARVVDGTQIREIKRESAPVVGPSRKRAM